jgi:hypothetical protein
MMKSPMNFNRPKGRKGMMYQNGGEVDYMDEEGNRQNPPDEQRRPGPTRRDNVMGGGRMGDSGPASAMPVGEGEVMEDEDGRNYVLFENPDDPDGEPVKVYSDNYGWNEVEGRMKKTEDMRSVQIIRMDMDYPIKMNEETGEYEQQGMREHTQYYPIGANFGFKFKPGKAMMTPEQFHGLVASPAPESRTGQQKGILESMDQGAPIAAPILRVKPDGSDFRVAEHEGRHRMQALRDAGLGDVPVPIEIQASGYQYPYDMNNEKLREMLAGATIQPEYGRYMASEIAPGTALSPDYPETYKTGLHPLNQPFTISDFDPYWNRGEYRDTV